MRPSPRSRSPSVRLRPVSPTKKARTTAARASAERKDQATHTRSEPSPPLNHPTSGTKWKAAATSSAAALPTGSRLKKPKRGSGSASRGRRYCRPWSKREPTDPLPTGCESTPMRLGLEHGDNRGFIDILHGRYWLSSSDLGAHERSDRHSTSSHAFFHPVSYTHLRAHETKANLVCRLLLEKKKK